MQHNKSLSWSLRENVAIHFLRIGKYLFLGWIINYNLQNVVILYNQTIHATREGIVHLKNACTCKTWQQVFKDWTPPSNIFDSTKSNIPVYCGIRIYFCPWCGHCLISDSELYEYIFCSFEGMKNRTELLGIYKDRLPALKLEHEKSGIKINGKAISFALLCEQNDDLWKLKVLGSLTRRLLFTAKRRLGL